MGQAAKMSAVCSLTPQPLTARPQAKVIKACLIGDLIWSLVPFAPFPFYQEVRFLELINFLTWLGGSVNPAIYVIKT